MANKWGIDIVVIVLDIVQDIVRQDCKQFQVVPIPVVAEVEDSMAGLAEFEHVPESEQKIFVKFFV